MLITNSSSLNPGNLHDHQVIFNFFKGSFGDGSDVL